MLNIENFEFERGDLRLRAHFSVPSGARLAVLGPSGCGKSTFLSVIAGVLPLKSGKIALNGRDLTRASPSERRITMMFQAHNLFARLTIAENIRLGRMSAHDDEIYAIAQSLEIEALLARYPHQISGGQGARVALARALLQNHDLWLLDEPFAALGPRQTRDFFYRISPYFQGGSKVLVFVTHDVVYAQTDSDFVLWFGDDDQAELYETEAFFAAPPASAQAYL